MDFMQAKLAYDHLKGQFEHDQISAEEFERRVNESAVTDENGIQWQIGVSSGKWYRYDGQNWVEDVPRELVRPSNAVAAKTAYVPSTPAVTFQSEPTYQDQNQLGKNTWFSGFLIVGALGLCCLVFAVGGWLAWRNNLITVEGMPVVSPVIPPSVVPFVPPLAPSVTAVDPSMASPEPGATAGSGSTPGQILFQDDFSNPESGWTRQIGRTVTNYIDGSYSVLVSEPNSIGFGLAFQNFGDVRMEVDTRKKAGSDDNDHGLICRESEDNGLYNYYFFVISSQGFAAIGKTVKNEAQYLWSEKVQPAGLIKTDTAINHLRADCKGSTLTLYVNGQQVASVNDTAFTSGDVGLLARAWATAGTEILYDNFVVYKPGN
ncbi:MAG: DUF1080 domain-containing protein [Anaerolineales bacterium]|nr:DUF1080 domain-containing protein [Anaerolineales bacterium]